MDKAVQKIKSAIKKAKKILVLAHMDPEGDAIGSTLAVYGYIKSLKKSVFAYNQDKIPDNLKFLKYSGNVINSIDHLRFDLTFILDCSEFKRVGKNFEEKLPDLGTIINIDHHVTSRGLGSINIIDSKASSTAEIIYSILKKLGCSFTKDLAEALYCALLTDTGSFRYSNSTPKAFRLAAELVNLGADPWKVSHNVYENFPASRLKLTSMVLSTLEIFENDRFASITLLDDMFAKTGALPEYSDGLVNYPRSVEGVEVAMIFKQAGEGSFKVGFRSKGNIDVSRIAASFGGGGHKNASGCTVSGDLDTVKQKIYDKTRKAVRDKFGADSSLKA
jgi:bifunctional oligoribonuclease and PAP phosphatase NrnA